MIKFLQIAKHRPFRRAFLCLGLFSGHSVLSADGPTPQNPPLGESASDATNEAETKPYTQRFRDCDVQFDMVPIPGGVFLWGSDRQEWGHKLDESPQRYVEVSPFWMGKTEVTWNEYELWSMKADLTHRKMKNRLSDEVDNRSDAVTRPTMIYMAMDFGMGRDGFPAVNMTQYAAKTYCEWLTAKTGHYYRLPTEAEWEYACRAGSISAYSFGDDSDQLDQYAWSDRNSEETYHKVGTKKPNRWGLHDMHGNVSEWVLDRYDEDFYPTLPAGAVTKFPYCLPYGKEYPRVIRGGSWMDQPNELRSAARSASSPDLKRQDPDVPQSIWYLTDGQMLGFRVIRPLTPPTEDEIKKWKFAPDLDETVKKYLRLD
ncbi:formylglycine-generating enzyme family protein [Planctomicrobium sp. SH661]|uniref:formylglycine-generating enzyme family protein n=1 Tax=Planctomicrobium sp. SH661 TaxID=3448124 RepID=UPI003F5C6B99